MTQDSLTIATRESPLALWQAHWVKQQLEIIHPNLSIKLLGMTTKADQFLEMPLIQIGGKGMFVKELEEALLDGRADIAVHSMKDVPMFLPEGLCLPVMCEREDPRDAFVSNHFSSLEQLPQQAKVGTSSVRRQSQLRAWRPDLDIVNLRGNVNTRLDKLDRGEFDAIILAAAGLKRLGFAERIRAFISIEKSLPAVGQGVLGIECRQQDDRIQQYIKSLDDEMTHACVAAERAMCAELGGGCQVPVASYAEVEDNKIFLRGLVASLDGKKILRAEASADLYMSERLGKQVAEELIQQGAEKILQDLAG